MDLVKHGNISFFQLVFGPDWALIASVRSFLQDFLSVSLSDEKTADAVSMAASELLENSIKYASKPGSRISGEYNSKLSKIVISVENYASTENIETLKTELERVNSGDPEKVYLEKMMEAALRTDGGSQLGFARIRYEANAEISLEVNRDLIKIKTVYNL